MKFRNFALLLMSFAISLPACAQAQATHEFRLANGMKIIVREDHRTPTVVHMVWYRAGSMDETSGTTGVAHVLEHMMFKGTKTLKPGEFSRKVAALGGRENAFTGKDYTAYYQQIDSAKLGEVITLEADRMNNLVLDEKEFAPEIKVIMEERRLRTEDRAASLLDESLQATAFTAHPYRWPIIGWMSDLQRMTVHDAQDWYQRWYAPNNATMVVVGDVKPAQVRALAEQHFGAIAARPLPLTRPQTEPQQRGIKRVLVKAPAENPAVILAFKVPALRDIEQDEDAYALDVLEAVLDGYDNARLNSKLVRADKIAHSVNASYDGFVRGPTLFTLAGTPVKGVSTLELEKRLRAEIERIANDGVTASELQRVKTQLIASQVYKRDSVFGQAMEIGSMEMAGVKHTDIDRIIDQLKAVTPQQVQAVARKYFGDDALTIATLAPQPLPAKTTPPAVKTRH
ncbi:MAG: insulinase family protein [Burkholderiaceae bacterium]|nr:insulinase family protein [Burkholderiaceae bacterium]